MTDLKTTKEERAFARGMAAATCEPSMYAHVEAVHDDLDTLEAAWEIVREVTTTFSHDEACEAVLGHDPDEDEWDDDLCDCAAGVLRATARRALEKKP